MTTETPTDANSETLLPCPMCGSAKASFGSVKYSTCMVLGNDWAQDTFHFVNCPSCGLSNQGVIGHQTEAAAAAAWNRRAAAQGATQPQPASAVAWRPISEAPKDGKTPVDLWFPQSGRKTNWRWYRKGQYWGAVVSSRHDRIETCWAEFPTHFCPIPAPPATDVLTDVSGAEVSARKTAMKMKSLFSGYELLEEKP